jgi:hypothetical protein
MEPKAASDNHYQPVSATENGPKPPPETQQTPGALTSEAFTGLKIGAPKHPAAGLMAVAKSMEHIARESGLVRGNKILLQLNQKDGFDCPGCAWPDPDGHRSKLEFEMRIDTTSRCKCLSTVKTRFLEENTLKRVASQIVVKTNFLLRGVLPRR